MTQTELIHNNFLIAVFMGYQYPDLNNAVFKHSFWDLHNYYEDWAQLMPVVKKLRNMYEWEWFYTVEFERMRGALLEVNMDEVWLACVELIELHNSRQLQ
jgi:hypothetical protein